MWFWQKQSLWRDWLQSRSCCAETTGMGGMTGRIGQPRPNADTRPRRASGGVGGPCLARDVVHGSVSQGWRFDQMMHSSTSTTVLAAAALIAVAGLTTACTTSSGTGTIAVGDGQGSATTSTTRRASRDFCDLAYNKWDGVVRA